MDIRLARRSAADDQSQLPGDIHPVVARVLRNRGIGTQSDIDYRLACLAKPTGLSDIDQAAELLAEAIADGKSICIVGDFDADGATASALCMRGLRMLGAADVRFEVPNRFDFGYGLSAPLVDHIESHSPADVLLTVDNGISSIEGVARAKELGRQVIVTDHHLPGAELPAADAIVNPNHPASRFGSPNLAGVGVAFYVLAALRAQLIEGGVLHKNRAPALADLLDLVALGTVADLVPLDHNNRILVSQGLKRIRSGKACAGIRALYQVAGRDLGRASATDLGYFIGPRLNAAGRLADMSTGIRCLLTDDDEEAAALASELDQLNRQRRDLQEDMEFDAMDRVSEGATGVVVFDPSWHQGIVGLVASRIKESLHRPCFAFAPASEVDATELKGSGRSIPGFHLRDALAAIATAQPGLFSRFGGHAMAAGMTLPHAHLDAFTTAFDDYTRAHLDEEALTRTVWTDGELAAADLNADLALLLRNWGPWGQAFPEPLFDGIFDVMERRAVGAKHTRLRLRPRGGSRPVDAIYFNHAPDQLPAENTVKVVYQLEANEYMGRITPQLIVRHLIH